MFESLERLTLGLISGMIFGFLLQKGRVAKFHVIVGQLLLRDWTVVRVMATAIAVGAIGVYALVQIGAAELHVKAAQLGGLISGALLFGAGMAVLGYCPGTSVAACGEGRRDAMMGVLGMLCGAALYVWLYPALQALVGLANWGQVTWPQLTRSSPWLWLLGLVAVTAAALGLLRRRSRRTPRPGW